MAEIINELPQELKDRGWSLQDEKWGWIHAVHQDGRKTSSHYPAKHRGLKFVLREIDRLEKEAKDAGS